MLPRANLIYNLTPQCYIFTPSTIILNHPVSSTCQSVSDLAQGPSTLPFQKNVRRKRFIINLVNPTSRSSAINQQSLDFNDQQYVTIFFSLLPDGGERSRVRHIFPFPPLEKRENEERPCSGVELKYIVKVAASDSRRAVWSFLALSRSPRGGQVQALHMHPCTLSRDACNTRDIFHPACSDDLEAIPRTLLESVPLDEN